MADQSQSRHWAQELEAAHQSLDGLGMWGPPGAYQLMLCSKGQQIHLARLLAQPGQALCPGA